jgi:hypothetical protein
MDDPMDQDLVERSGVNLADQLEFDSMIRLVRWKVLCLERC